MNATTSAFKQGDRVLYVPLHTNGDIAHPDCERGIVTSTNAHYVFAKYYDKRGNLQSCSEATSPEDLVHLSASNAATESVKAAVVDHKLPVLAWQEDLYESNRYRVTDADQTHWIASLLLNGEYMQETQAAQMNHIVRSVNSHDKLLKALEALVNWGRDNTGPLDANSPHTLLIDAIVVMNEAKGVTL